MAMALTNARAWCDVEGAGKGVEDDEDFIENQPATNVNPRERFLARATTEPESGPAWRKKRTLVADMKVQDMSYYDIM